ncbi:unnamed protein product [Merluccius merluccius]
MGAGPHHGTDNPGPPWTLGTTEDPWHRRGPLAPPRTPGTTEDPWHHRRPLAQSRPVCLATMLDNDNTEKLSSGNSNDQLQFFLRSVRCPVPPVVEENIAYGQRATIKCRGHAWTSGNLMSPFHDSRQNIHKLFTFVKPVDHVIVENRADP